MSIDNTAGMMRLFNIGSGNVTEEKALGLSTVYACVRVLSEGVASLPFYPYQHTDSGKEVARSHSSYKLLHKEPNPLMSSFTFRKILMTHVLLWGNFYAWIERGPDFRPIALWPRMPWEVQPVMQDGVLFYRTKVGMIPDYDMIHVTGLGLDGIEGKSPIKIQAEQLGINLNAQKYGADFFQKGATIGGILTNDSGVVYTPEQRKQLKEAWYEDAHGQSANHGTKIMGGGLKYQRVGVPPEEAQFLQTRKMGAAEICGMYNVPGFMVGVTGDGVTTWGSGIESMTLGFVKFSLMAWLINIEQEFDRKIFRESEKETYSTGHNVNGMLRGDMAAQTQHIKEMQDRGNYTINQALKFLGQNTIGPEGDRRFVMRNMVPLDRVDETINEQPKTSNSDGEGK